MVRSKAMRMAALTQDRVTQCSPAVELAEGSEIGMGYRRVAEQLW